MGVWTTPEGGMAVQMINKTGSVSKKGTLVTLHGSIDFAVKIVPADMPNPIGVVYNDGSADGDQVWVVVGGVAYVLLEDNTAATASYWVRVSENQNGRVDATNQLPAGGTIAALEGHMEECGHCMQTVAAGTDKLARCIIHFN